MSQITHPPPSPDAKSIQCRVHGRFADWLARSGGSLVVSTYTSGKLVLVSSIDGRVCVRVRRFARPMGIAIRGRCFAAATQRKILRFRDTGEPKSGPDEGSPPSRSDARYVVEREFAIGKVNAHDVSFGERGLYFANTRFNCVARVSSKRRFICTWRPPFIRDLVAQDRCHLNGIGMEEGRPRMVTAFCESGDSRGWREQDRSTGGVLMDVQRNGVVARGLCMPHSPRLHSGSWWLCNSGHGMLNKFDAQAGECPEVCALPGFTRGLSFVGNYALVGLSRIRREHVLDAPPVRERHSRLMAGVGLVDLRTGRHVGSLEFVRGGAEVFDVVFLRNKRRPNLVGFSEQTTCGTSK